MRLAFNRAMNPDGFDECTFGAMLGFDEAFELVCVGFVHLETFLVRVLFVAPLSAKNIEKSETRRANREHHECFHNPATASCGR